MTRHNGLGNCRRATWTTRQLMGAALLPVLALLTATCTEHDDVEDDDGGAAGETSLGGHSGTGRGGTEQGGTGAAHGGITNGGSDEPGGGGAGGGAARCDSTLTTSCLAALEESAGAGGAAGSGGSGGGDGTHSAVLSAVAELKNVSALNAVNRHDQMVGSRECDGQIHAFMFDHGSAHDLLQGLDDRFSEATDINDDGVVIGQVTLEADPSGALPTVPFIWKEGVATLLSDVSGRSAVAVNNLDQVVIQGSDNEGGLLWENGDLTPLGASTKPYSINNLGQIVGQLFKSGGATVGFIWEDGEITELPEFSSALAINDGGQIAGVSAAGRAALWDGQQLVELGDSLPDPVAIGADGAVLGPSYLYANGALSNLRGVVNDDAFEEVDARDINRNHLIVGRGVRITFEGGGSSCQNEGCEVPHDHAVVWSPDCFRSCCGQASGGAGGSGG